MTFIANRSNTFLTAPGQRLLTIWRTGADESASHGNPPEHRSGPTLSTRFAKEQGAPNCHRLKQHKNSIVPDYLHFHRYELYGMLSINFYRKKRCKVFLLLLSFNGAFLCKSRQKKGSLLTTIIHLANKRNCCSIPWT